MKVIITGATGLVGEGVLRICLNDPMVTKVLSISRKPLQVQHTKLSELILTDFTALKDQSDLLEGYEGCFFCAGVSSLGENEESFTRKTYDFVVPFAETLVKITPKMTFIYVSGNRTDGTEHGKVMWARVKGRTENAIARLPFKAVYNFRPGFMRPVKGQHHVRWIYRAFDVLSPFWYLVLPDWICKMQEVGDAMIECVRKGYPKTILEVADIKRQARKKNAAS
ncbi:NAD-dependent epimerase/dehydratase family protein [Mucilaginibacter sp. CAU 1740]|uniref:NAD-dependent epimerase/dehydratase family protein n=1 Tax=Mucilaginibacter sp. CAU 1740 TaxID=3140365 RepID=UPI00325B397C